MVATIAMPIQVYLGDNIPLNVCFCWNEWSLHSLFRSHAIEMQVTQLSYLLWIDLEVPQLCPVPSILWKNWKRQEHSRECVLKSDEFKRTAKVDSWVDSDLNFRKKVANRKQFLLEVLWKIENHL